MGALAATTMAQANTNSTEDSSATTQTTDSGTSQGENFMMDAGFGGRGGHFGQGSRGGMGGIEVSQEYTDNVNAILNSDSDVANLISQGYNVTAIRPIVKSVVQGDTTLTTQATTAVVTMSNGTSEYVTVNVDVENAQVTQITTVTRTVIDKTSG
jgi:hypothetical protein